MPVLSNLLNLANAVTPAITGAFSNAGQQKATNTLTAGGQQGINTITTGAQNAQNTLAQNLQAQKTALAPFINPGATAATTISNMGPYTPQTFTPQTFNWTPADIANDPAYKFRLEQGQAAIDAAGNAAGTRFSGATLKDLSQFNTGEAAQAEQQDYQRQLGTFQTNEGNQFSAFQTNQGNALTAYQTELAKQQNLESQGLNAAGQQTSTANTTANATANIQTSSAQQIAELQTQIANAQAAGNVAQAANLQNTLTSLLGGAPQAVSAVNNLLNPASNATANPANVANGTNPLNPNNSGANSGTGLNNSASNPPTTSANGNPQTTQQYNPDTGQVENVAIPAAGAAAGGVAAASGAGATGASLGATVGLSQAAPAGAVIGSGLEAGAGEAAAAAGTEAAAATGAEAAAGEAGAAATTGASGGVLSSVGAFLTNPITIGVGAALLAGYAIIKALQVHPTADKFVQNVQNPFGQQLGTVVDGFDKALASGQLNKSDAQAMRDQTAQMIQGFQQAGEQFAAKGGKEQTVWKQAQQTMATDFGANWEKILSKMDSEIAGLPARAA